jgi:hypothetical protein
MPNSNSFCKFLQKSVYNALKFTILDPHCLQNLDIENLLENMVHVAGCSAGVAHLFWEQRVVGSNPIIPI